MPTISQTLCHTRPNERLLKSRLPSGWRAALLLALLPSLLLAQSADESQMESILKPSGQRVSWTLTDTPPAPVINAGDPLPVQLRDGVSPEINPAAPHTEPLPATAPAEEDDADEAPLWAPPKSDRQPAATKLTPAQRTQSTWEPPARPSAGRDAYFDLKWEGSWLDGMETYLQQRSTRETEQLGELKSELERLQRSLVAERSARNEREKDYRQQLDHERLRRELLMQRLRNQEAPTRTTEPGNSGPRPTPAETPGTAPQHELRVDSDSSPATPGGPAEQSRDGALSREEADSGRADIEPVGPNQGVSPRGSRPPANSPPPGSQSPPSAGAYDEPDSAVSSPPLTRPVSLPDTPPADSDLPEADSESESSTEGPTDENLQRMVEGAVDRVAFADNLFAAGRTREALQVYRRLWEEYPADQKPDSESLWYEFQIATCYRRLGALDLATQMFQRVLGSGQADSELSEYARWWITNIENNARLRQGIEQVAAVVKTLEEGPQ